MKKQPFLDQKHWLTPLEYMQGNTCPQGYVFPKRWNTHHQGYVFPRWGNSYHQGYVFPRSGNTSLGICLSQVLERISLGICVSQVGEHMSLGIKKVGKMAIFGPKPWVNPFGKMSTFRLFELYVFIAQKGVFRSTISLKTFSWLILPKKRVEKIAIFGPKEVVSPFGIQVG